MRKVKITILALIFMSTFSNAQTESNRVAFGFNINQIQNDFGVGIDIISPYFANSKVALKVGGNFKWFEHMNENEITWSPYQSVQLGIRGRQFIIEDKFFIYGEGGSIILIPNEIFSSESSQIGGYGLFGFEFKPSNTFGFYIEIGGVGTGAKADKLSTKPIYSNGFLTNVGFRTTL